MYLNDRNRGGGHQVLFSLFSEVYIDGYKSEIIAKKTNIIKF
ncbi:hypothetical protein CLV99_2974 [Sphingobacterium yanglingense]|uniref:Uncharacterized protein n=1 Tax=Sphingobacterium yanglingense TaxID=1437280 RepID=A0A4R6WEH3_9SPHI|nr:hypothetical protein CLV99_2974 [Sphingobacterium yanglingense]